MGTQDGTCSCEEAGDYSKSMKTEKDSGEGPRKHQKVRWVERWCQKATPSREILIRNQKRT